MKNADLASYRQTLLALRNRLTGDVSHLADEALRANGGEASGSLSNAPLHMADLGTDNFEQEFTLSLLQNQEQALEEITEAWNASPRHLRQMRGVPGAIPKARLQALPYTRHCVACARKLQQSSEETMSERSYRVLLWVLALTGLALDQASKYGVFPWLRAGGQYLVFRTAGRLPVRRAA